MNSGAQAIETQPQGDNQPFNRLLLQAPGVAQDLFGQLHVRGDHGNLQFRLNGVILPEGINVFGQALQTRLANSVSLITGALPAQYGLRTAGIIDIQTKTGTLTRAARSRSMAASKRTFQPSAEWGGRVGQIDYYVNRRNLHNAEGIENPAPTFNAIHDISDQPRGFAYISGIIDPTTRITGIFGVSRSEYQIPNNPGQTPSLGLTVDGVSDFNSAAAQREPAPDHRLRDRRAAEAGRRARFPGLRRHPLQRRLFLPRSARRPAVQRHRPDRLRGRVSPMACRATAAMRCSRRPHVAQRILHPGRALARSSTNSQRAAGRSRPACRPATSRSRSSIRAQRPAGSTALTCRTNGGSRPKLTVNFGARFDQMAEFVNARQLSPRVNVVWQPTEATTLTAGYARYFTPPPFELIAPTTISLFADTTAAPTVTLDSRAKPERDHYFDVGATHVILPGLKAGIDAYYKIASDLIDEGQFGAPILLTPFNYQKGLVDGVEADPRATISATGRSTGILRRRGRSARTSSRPNSIFDPDELAYIANHYIHLDHDQTYTASAGIKYRFPQAKTLLSPLI